MRALRRVSSFLARDHAAGRSAQLHARGAVAHGQYSDEDLELVALQCRPVLFQSAEGSAVRSSLRSRHAYPAIGTAWGDLLISYHDISDQPWLMRLVLFSRHGEPVRDGAVREVAVGDRRNLADARRVTGRNLVRLGA